jgi:drug/metabolite transporter (DMT)-like permease
MGDVLKPYQLIGAACIFTGMFVSLKYTTKNKSR